MCLKWLQDGHTSKTAFLTVIFTAVKPRLLLVLTSDLPITCWSANLKWTGNWFLEIKTLWSLRRWSHVMIMLCPSLFQGSTNHLDPLRSSTMLVTNFGLWCPTIVYKYYWDWRQKNDRICHQHRFGVCGSCNPTWFLISIDITIFCRHQRSFLIYKKS